MVLRDDKNYVIGSAALSPKRDLNTVEKERYKELEQAKKQRKLRIRASQKKRKASVMQIVLLVFAVGITLIYRDAKIYTMQKELSNINREIESTRLKNEALKIDLLKVSSIEYVKNTAQTKLQMVEPQKNAALIVDFSKDNFKEPEETKIKGGFINNIINQVEKFLF